MLSEAHTFPVSMFCPGRGGGEAVRDGAARSTVRLLDRTRSGRVLGVRLGCEGRERELRTIEEPRGEMFLFKAAWPLRIRAGPAQTESQCEAVRKAGARVWEGQAYRLCAAIQACVASI